MPYTRYRKAEVRSSGDEMSGEVEPELRLLITENATTPENERRYMVEIKWSERAASNDLYSKSFLYVDAYYAEYRLDPNKKWTAVPGRTRIPLRLRRDLSFAIFDGKKISLNTNTLIEQGHEAQCVRKATKDYGEGNSDGAKSSCE